MRMSLSNSLLVAIFIHEVVCHPKAFTVKRYRRFTGGLEAGAHAPAEGL